MPNQRETLARLNREKDYEDKLARDLDWFFIDSLPVIADLDEEQKEEVRQQLRTIIYDSIRHSYMFNELVGMVLENGEDNY